MAAKQGVPRLDRELELSPAMGGDVPWLEAGERDRVSPKPPSYIPIL